MRSHINSKTVHMHVGDTGNGGYISCMLYTSAGQPIQNPNAGRIFMLKSEEELLKKLGELRDSGLRIPTKYKKSI